MDARKVFLTEYVNKDEGDPGRQRSDVINSTSFVRKENNPGIIHLTEVV